MLSKRCFFYFRISILISGYFHQKGFNPINKAIFIGLTQIYHSTKSLKINEKIDEVQVNIQNVCIFVL